MPEVQGMSGQSGDERLGRLLQDARMTRAGLLRAGLAVGVGAAAPAHAAAAAPRRTREYWIAAVPTTWNAVPNGRNAIEDVAYPPDRTVFEAVVYRQFARNWKRQLRSPEQNAILGPLIKARVGDRILVHFKNLDTTRPHSMHFHGVRYEFGSDGSYIPGFSGPGGNVAPGKTHTYELFAETGSAGVWPYHDHSPSMMDSSRSGLYGAMTILKRGETRPDREFVVFFGAHLEFMTINGRAFVGNTPIFRARVGETVQWDVLAIGEDFHTFHIHGHRWKAPDGTPVDTRTIGPAESFAIRFREDVPGTWLYHCHVESHMQMGMIGIYQVRR
jgi:FtsP/CotA-like multicopper oxidase with cupredoxin domain